MDSYPILSEEIILPLWWTAKGMTHWTHNYKVQITDKITAFLSNSPTRALADLLPFTKAVKAVTQRPGQEWHRQSHSGHTDNQAAALGVCKTSPEGLENLPSTFHRELFNENKYVHGFFPPSNTICLKLSQNSPKFNSSFKSNSWSYILEKHPRLILIFSVTDNQPQHWKLTKLIFLSH